MRNSAVSNYFQGSSHVLVLDDEINHRVMSRETVKKISAPMKIDKHLLFSSLIKELFKYK